MPSFRRLTALMTIGLAVLDSCFILAAYAVACYLLTPADAPDTFSQVFREHFAYFLVFVLVWTGAATDQRLFHSRRQDTLFAQLFAAFKAVLFSIVLTGFVIPFLLRQDLSRDFIIRFGIAAMAAILLFRSVMRLVLWTLRRVGLNQRHVLIVGANPRSRHLVDVVMQHGRYGYDLVGFLDDEPERGTHYDGYDIPWVGRLEDLEKVLLDYVIDEVYICLPVKGYYEEISSMAHLCEGIGVPVRLIADLFRLRVATGRVHQFEDIPLLSLSAVPEAELQLFAKRLLDILVALLFFVLVGWWLFPLVAVLIKLDSKGPVFFAQERVGLNQRRFKMLKFRSMVADAEKLKQQLAAQNEADGPVFKMRRDPRMTRAGRVLRKFSIDELPQFVNVFMGHMSLVGPRPPVPKEVEQYTWDQRRRLSVRPGITGLQQVSGRSDLTFDEWVELDLAYIDNWSLAEDFRILFRTFQVVVLARGAA